MSQERFHQIIEGMRGYWHYKGRHILIHFIYRSQYYDPSHVEAHQFNPQRGGPIFGPIKWFSMMCLILVQSLTSNGYQIYINSNLLKVDQNYNLTCDQSIPLRNAVLVHLQKVRMYIKFSSPVQIIKSRLISCRLNLSQ